MKLFKSGSISKKLVFLVMLAVLPALVVLLYAGIEQRRLSIGNAKRDLLLIAGTMAELQQDITQSTKQILSTLSLLPEVQDANLAACHTVFKAVLAQNPDYQNITLTNLQGIVQASGLSSSGVSLADRKHVREAIQNKKFAAGEYIMSRVGITVPAFAYANPVFDQGGQLKAILTTSIKLDRFFRFYDLSMLPEKSFVAITDHQGLRLYYYPQNPKTNPVGKPIKPESWNIASKAQGPGIFIGEGSDGVRRLFAYEQVRLTPEDAPYIYVWAGIPENPILKIANVTLARNLAVMTVATLMSLFIAWSIGERTLISPIKRLVALTQEFAKGNLESRNDLADRTDEVGSLTEAFHDMADILLVNEKALRENEARFRLVLDSLDTVVYVADMDTYEILFINEHARKAFGDVTGQICWQSLQKDQTGPCPFCTNKYLLDAEGNPGSMYTWEHQNGHTGKWFYIHDQAIQWVDGRIVRIEMASDITEKLRTENELAKAKRLESTGVLAGGIAHDFNNILVAILGNIDLSLSDTNLKDDTRKQLEGAVNACYQARDLTQQLLTFAKGGAPIKKAASLIDVIKDSANFVLRGGKTACNYSFPDDLWLVDIDKGQISQVIHNLILNASSAMPKGGIVEVSCENFDPANTGDIDLPRAGNHVKICIKDFGGGIPANIIDKIFDPYFSTKEKGSGLGLAISHSIISKHDGHIAVQSTQGVGTTFTIYLPASAKRSVAAGKAKKTEVEMAKSRVLVMDDEKMVRDLLEAMLNRMGHEVILVEGGEQAIAAYKKALANNRPVDLTIMDLTIPGGMGGKRAVRKILAINPDAKVMVSSGYSNDPIMAKFKEFGFCAAIAKPYQLSELTNVVSHLIT